MPLLYTDRPVKATDMVEHQLVIALRMGEYAGRFNHSHHSPAGYFNEPRSLAGFVALVAFVILVALVSFVSALFLAIEG